MVAISLYRGNLHKVPDVPRRWLMPTPKISPKDFRLLHHRRIKSLNSHRSTAELASTSNPNPNPDGVIPMEVDNGGRGLEETKKVETKSNGGGGEEKLGQDAEEKPVLKLVEKIGVDEADIANPLVVHGKLKEVKLEPVKIPNLESKTSKNKDDEPSEKEKRNKEVEEKLIVLNEKKHKLVQVLKQIIQAEEELKRRNNTQVITNRPPVPPSLQVDTTNVGSPVGNAERAETDDASNHNLNSRLLLRTSSASPTSESLQRRPPFSAVPHPSRTSLAGMGSPMRFTPAGHLPPVVSVSGTSYTTSSPSPAASGGTSVLRDRSPWN
ncbi:uncharacterized protein LOC124917960 [Impatiens glandulifera]|uniref:uncharacterized protein LOC124917960 n=1 Tax=Impatiens glandulifera TaxID=253017 RepID=UPI001FB0D8D5|nr:uncharacterized protein LOC124917960 [Impatiens glandulifera]